MDREAQAQAENLVGPMTRQRMLDAAQLLGEFGNGKMANELIRHAERWRWRPIEELHEDYGLCVLINLDDPGHMEVGSNLDIDYEESLWSHFSHIVPLSQEEAEDLQNAQQQRREAAGEAEVHEVKE